MSTNGSRKPAPLHAGWFLLTFTDELTEEITPIRLGARRLMVIRREDGKGGFTHEVADSTCPHRGADLAHGGELRGNCVACPFHGRLIQVGGEHERRHVVASHQTVEVGPLLFVRLATGPEGSCDFDEIFPAVIGDRQITTAVNQVVDVPLEFVVENAFDIEHFPTVHGVPSLDGMRTSLHPSGYLSIGGDFLTAGDPWYDLRFAEKLEEFVGKDAFAERQQRSAFRATAYSPSVVVTSFGTGVDDPLIITGAAPTEDGRTIVRVAVAGRPTDPVTYIATGSRAAIAQDARVWEHIDHEAPWALDERDENVIAFRAFCDDFPMLDAVAAQPSSQEEVRVP